MAVAPLSDRVKAEIHRLVDEVLFDPRARSLAEALSHLPFDITTCDDCGIPDYRERARAALRAQRWFYQFQPYWTADLPLSPGHCRLMINAPNPRFVVLGLYGNEFRRAGWDEGFPDFYSWGRRLLQDPATPARLRNDPELRAEFAPPNVVQFPGR